MHKGQDAGVWFDVPVLGIHLRQGPSVAKKVWNGVREQTHDQVLVLWRRLAGGPHRFDVFLGRRSRLALDGALGWLSAATSTE